MPLQPGQPVNFLHRRTVRFKPEKGTDVDSKVIINALGLSKEDVVGIVPLYGGQCFDITVTTPEKAVEIAQKGLPLNDKLQSLTLLGRKTIAVSVFVSIEFPDELLLKLLKTYGELKSDHVRRLYFRDEGLTHLENGTRIVEFVRLDKHLPKQIVAYGIPIGLKYSGQANTCFRCGSTEHLVKACPKRKDRKAPPPVAEQEGMDSSPSQPTPTVSGDHVGENTPQAQATQSSSASEELHGTTLASNPNETPDLFSQLEDPTETTVSPAQEQRPTQGKRGPPPSPTKAVESAKRRIYEVVPPSSTAYKLFIEALDNDGPARKELMKQINGKDFYICRALRLQAQHGAMTEDNSKRLSSSLKDQWQKVSNLIPQDAFKDLLDKFKALDASYQLFQE